MNSHRNARTTPYSRALIVERHAGGETVAAIAAAFGISVRTVYKWLTRYRVGGEAGLDTGLPRDPGRSLVESVRLSFLFGFWVQGPGSGAHA